MMLLLFAPSCRRLIFRVNVIQVQRVMGCSAEDLIRWLPDALGELLQSTAVTIDDKTSYQVPNAILSIIGHTKPPNKLLC